jgi:hypothetical protein
VSTVSTTRRKKVEARTRRALEAGRRPMGPVERALTLREGPEIEEDDVPVSGHFARRGIPDPTAKDEEE